MKLKENDTRTWAVFSKMSSLNASFAYMDLFFFFSLDVKLRRRDDAKRAKYTFCLFEGGKFLK